jgi:hypothetical protein
MKSSLLVLFTLLVSLVSLAQDKPAAGPFGFERGMTREQIVQIVGKDAVDAKSSTGNMMMVTKAPKSNPAFENYLLIISPTQGLLKLIAVGTTVHTGDSGMELKSAYEAVLAGVSQRYGSTEKQLDGCNGGTGCTGNEYWMLGLYEKNRYLTALWTPNSPGNSVKVVAVEAHAANLNSGWVTVTYEFEGFTQYIDATQSKQNESY